MADHQPASDSAVALTYASGPIARSVRWRVFTAVSLRAAVGALLLTVTAAAPLRCIWLQGAYAHFFAAFDRRITVGPELRGKILVEVGFPVRANWKRPIQRRPQTQRVVGAWDTGLPMMPAVFPLLLRRCALRSVLIGAVSAIGLTSLFAAARLWLWYLLLLTDIPLSTCEPAYWPLHWPLRLWLIDTIPFGIEFLLCVFICVRFVRASSRSPGPDRLEPKQDL